MNKKIIIFLLLTMVVSTFIGCGAKSTISENESSDYSTKNLSRDENYTICDIRESFATRDVYTYSQISVLLEDSSKRRYYVCYLYVSDGTRKAKDDTYLKLALLDEGDIVTPGIGDYELIIK